ncbi:MAG TPA: hypothetical protein VFG04_12855 [Planctomycetaceae bacterium]|jgi:hypothetical protein|nr:hypothetical protein [Planctomycetaceae bacterium]
MRLSLGSVGTLTIALLVAFAFWPENRAVRGPEPVVAQDKPKARDAKSSTTASPQKKASNEPRATDTHAAQSLRPIVREPAPLDRPLSSDVVYRSINEARIAAALKSQVDFEIKPQSFKDALDFIASHYQISILIDQKAFDDANIDTSVEVTFNASGIALRDMLQWLFSEMPSPIRYEFRNGVLLISTYDKIRDDQMTVVYDCRDLIPLGAQDPADESTPSSGGGGFFQIAPSSAPNPGTAAPASQASQGPNHRMRAAARKAAKLISALKAAMTPEDFDGGGDIRPILYFQGLIVARQNSFDQRNIRRLLADIRWMRTQGAFAPPGDPKSQATSISIPTSTTVRRGPEQLIVEDTHKPRDAKSSTTRAPQRKANKEQRTADNQTTRRPPIVLEDERVNQPLSSDVPERSKNEARIAEVLNVPVDFRLQEQPFKDAVDFIAAHYHIPILIDKKGLADANVDPDTKVQVDIPGITLHDLLHWLLTDLNSPLDYEVCNGALLISTIDKLNEDVSIVVYDCRDLLKPASIDSADAREQNQGKDEQVKPHRGESGAQETTGQKGSSEGANSRLSRRVSWIQAIIASLDNGPDEARISEFDGLLVIRQNPLGHERIKQLLASIRLMKKTGAFARFADQFEEPKSGALAHPK